MQILMIIGSKEFNDDEFFQPKDVFENQGYSIKVASSRMGVAISSEDRKVHVDILAQKADPSAYDAIVFVGGLGAKEFFHDDLVHDLIEDALADGKVVGAICIAPLVLAYAGVLSDKRTTVSPHYVEEIKKYSGEYTGDSVTIDGQIVTADGPKSAEKFAESIIEQLAE